MKHTWTREALLVQEDAQASGRIKVQPAAGNDENSGESAKQGEQIHIDRP